MPTCESASGPGRQLGSCGSARWTLTSTPSSLCRVYDPVGMLIPSLKCIAWNGRAIVVGFAAGAIEKVRRGHVVLLSHC